MGRAGEPGSQERGSFQPRHSLAMCSRASHPISLSLMFLICKVEMIKLSFLETTCGSWISHSRDRGSPLSTVKAQASFLLLAKPRHGRGGGQQSRPWQGGQQPACFLGPRTSEGVCLPAPGPSPRSGVGCGWGGGVMSGPGGETLLCPLPSALSSLPSHMSSFLHPGVARPVRPGHSPHSSPRREAGLSRVTSPHPSPLPLTPAELWPALPRTDRNRP